MINDGFDSPEFQERVKRMLADNRYIDAIKCVREHTVLGLRE